MSLSENAMIFVDLKRDTVVVCSRLRLVKELNYCNIPVSKGTVIARVFRNEKQEGQHPLTGQRAAKFRLLANQPNSG